MIDEPLERKKVFELEEGVLAKRKIVVLASYLKNF